MTKIFVLTIYTLMLAGGHGYAQQLTESDSVIMTALKDELQNNMDNLREESYDKPFFIGYRVSDMSLKLASASFGALVSSKSTVSRDWNSRVMVGSYELNDENFTDSFEGNNNDIYFENVPLGADYWGLRRVLWASTNNVYKRAARLYKQKKKAIVDYKIQYPFADFLKTPPKKYVEEQDDEETSLQELERLTKGISGYIADFDSIKTASAILTDINARNYYFNSEGTEIIKNEKILIGLVSITRTNGDNELQNARLDYFGVESKDFPSEELIRKDIDWTMNDLQNRSKFDALEEDYNGPVMLRGQAVADFFKANLFKVEGGILPQRKSFNNKSEETVTQFFEELSKELKEEDKVKVSSKQITVTLLSDLTEFNGTKLIGAYDIDADGNVPPKELVLIKDGKVQQKINGRIPAPFAEESTGSSRFSIAIGSVSNLIAPGIIKVDFDNTMSEADLVKVFNERVIENDAEAGVVIQVAPLNSMSKPRQYFLKSLDGDEKQ
ncbi:MAG: hypothetical protein AAFO69_13945, partial [Bacteroidota bacterium]